MDTPLFANDRDGLFADLKIEKPCPIPSDRALICTNAVDLTWTWSKRQDLADQLRSRVRRLAGQDPNPVEDRQRSPRTTAKAAAPRRVADRLGEATVRELIEARRAGTKLRELVDRYGISESSVKRLISIDHASNRSVSQIYSTRQQPCAKSETLHGRSDARGGR